MTKNIKTKPGRICRFSDFISNLPSIHDFNTLYWIKLIIFWSKYNRKCQNINKCVMKNLKNQTKSGFRSRNLKKS